MTSAFIHLHKWLYQSSSHLLPEYELAVLGKIAQAEKGALQEYQESMTSEQEWSLWDRGFEAASSEIEACFS